MKIQNGSHRRHCRKYRALNARMGAKTVAFALNVKQAGRYEVFLVYYAFGNRPENVPDSSRKPSTAWWTVPGRPSRTIWLPSQCCTGYSLSGDRD